MSISLSLSLSSFFFAPLFYFVLLVRETPSQKDELGGASIYKAHAYTRMCVRLWFCKTTTSRARSFLAAAQKEMHADDEVVSA
jgi:hypothetical protein